MKKITLFWSILLILSGCSDFLTTENLVQKDSSSFPANAEDMNTALMSVYSSAKKFNGEPWQCLFILSELMSDDRLGGGGVNDRHAQAVNEFKKNSDNMYAVRWKLLYEGIYRANFVLENAGAVHWETEAERDKIEGQACFMRAYFYFDLCRMFEKVPLILSTKVENTPRASVEELYGQIGSDLKKAIELLPGRPFSSIPQSEAGLATKWAAEALLGRVWLFYSGYYKKESLSLTDGTMLDKRQALAYLEDCIANSGHDLVPDFRSLWPYAYSNVEYNYAKANGLEWIGEDGANNETVFAIKYSALGSGSDASLANQVNLFFGLRGQDQLPFGRGWGFGPVNPQLYEDWPDKDMRKKASIYYVDDPEEGTTGYIWNGMRNKQETGYYQKKYMPVNVRNAAGKIVNYSCVLYGKTPNYQYDNSQDLVIIRFSDVLLMATEMGSANAQLYMNRVRKRVGLPSVLPTLENIKKERRFELAFEGVRYYDLLRWGDAEKEINKLVNIPVKDLGAPASVTVKFRPETRGFLPIPSNEIALSNGVLDQNPGWDGPNVFY